MAPRAQIGWLVVGMPLMAVVAACAGVGWPIAITGRTGWSVLTAALAGWGGVALILGVWATVDAVGRARRRDLDGLQRAADRVKRVAIAFFMINYVGLGLWVYRLAMIEAGGSRVGVYVFLAVVAATVATYLVMLPTSAYGIATLALLRRDGRIGRPFFGLVLALHLLFVLDVIGSVLVVEMARHALRRSPVPGPVARQLLTVVVGFCSALALAWIVLGSVDLFGDVRALDPVVAALTLTTPVALLLLVVVPVEPLVTLRTGTRLYLQGDLETLRRVDLTVKIAAIPLFVQNFLLCAALVSALTLLPIAASRGTIIFLGPLAVLLVGAFSSVGLVPTVIATYLMMLTTSCYGIAAAAAALRSRKVSRGFGVTMIILHLVFVADVVAALVQAAGLNPGRSRTSASVLP